MDGQIKYEYMILSAHQKHITENLEKEYADGWEVAGSSDVKYHGDPAYAAFIYIPMRREIKPS